MQKTKSYINAEHELVLCSKTGERLDVARNLEDLQVMLDFEACYINREIFDVMKRAVYAGLIGKWLKLIGEDCLEELLQPFEKSDLRKYCFAFGLLSESMEEPTSNFSRVIGYENAKKRLLEMSVLPTKLEKLGKKYGVQAQGGVLLYGPPGCGKSYLAQALAGETKNIFVTKSMAEICGPKDMALVFGILRTFRGSVLFVDEVETITVNRDSEGISSRFVSNQLLVELSNREPNTDLVFIGATNAPWIIDPAMIRSGRLDNLLYIGVPDRETRKGLLDFYSKDLPMAKIDFDKVADATEFYSCSDMEMICKEAALIPWREAVDGGEERPVCQSDFETAVENCTSTAIPWFESALNVIFSDYMKPRFAPMLAELERYKKWRK